jgi:hypothetical protein
MAGKIVADTLEHSTAGSVTTDYVVNGSAKAWNTIDGTGTVSSYDSFNASSTDDNSTGNYTTNLTNAMSITNHSATGSTTYAGGSGYTYITVFPDSTSEITSNHALDGSGESDVDPLTHITFGDLA